MFIGGPGGVNSTIVNTTISGNTSNLSGGGMYCTTTSVLDAPSVTLNAVTVVGNHSDEDNSGVGGGGGLATLLLAGYERTKELRYWNCRVDIPTYGLLKKQHHGEPSVESTTSTEEKSTGSGEDG